MQYRAALKLKQAHDNNQEKQSKNLSIIEDRGGSTMSAEESQRANNILFLNKATAHISRSESPLYL